MGHEETCARPHGDILEFVRSSMAMGPPKRAGNDDAVADDHDGQLARAKAVCSIDQR